MNSLNSFEYALSESKPLDASFFMFRPGWPVHRFASAGVCGSGAALVRDSVRCQALVSGANVRI